jgi:hypothetical protein
LLSALSKKIAQKKRRCDAFFDINFLPLAALLDDNRVDTVVL